MTEPEGDELRRLADLSHLVERLASALVIQGTHEHLAAAELVDLAAGHREAVAIAFAYALRTAERDPGDVPARAVELLRAALAPALWRDGGTGGGQGRR